MARRICGPRKLSGTTLYLFQREKRILKRYGHLTLLFVLSLRQKREETVTSTHVCHAWNSLRSLRALIRYPHESTCSIGRMLEEIIIERVQMSGAVKLKKNKRTVGMWLFTNIRSYGLSGET